VFYNGKLQKLPESQISVEESISTERSGKKVSETVSHVVRTYVCTLQYIKNNVSRFQLVF